jgi:hypothetical protein
MFSVALIPCIRNLDTHWKDQGRRLVGGPAGHRLSVILDKATRNVNDAPLIPSNQPYCQMNAFKSAQQVGERVEPCRKQKNSSQATNS